MQRVGFIGLGVMGEPMARHLWAARNQLVVWNRTPAKTDALAELGASVARSIPELAEQCEVILTCVGTSEDMTAVVDEILPAAKPGTLVIDHSTIEPAVAGRLAERLAQRQMRLVDAPVTGGSMGAKNGTLTIFCGGDPADVAEAISMIKPYTKRAERVGEIGAGQRMKLANQIAVGGALLGLCEALAFAQKSGLDLAQARDMIAGGAGGSWAFEHYGPKILSADWTPGFSIKNQQKDFRYCIAAARDLAARVPTTELAHQLLSELEAGGRAEDTTAALFEAYLGRAAG